MLKSKITKEEFDALPDALKEFYKEANGSYLLQSDGADELRNALTAERQNRETLQTQFNELKAQIDAANEAKRAAEEEAARKAKDLPAIEASWQQKLDAAKEASEAEANRLKGMLEKLLVDNTAISIANEIGKNASAAKLLLPHIKARLKAELDGDAGITRVLDKDGKPSATSIAELQQEFVANADFADIIKGTNANGGGANGNGGSGGGMPGGKKFQELTEAERVALHKENPVKYRELAAAAGVKLPTM